MRTRTCVCLLSVLASGCFAEADAVAVVPGDGGADSDASTGATGPELTTSGSASGTATGTTTSGPSDSSGLETGTGGDASSTASSGASSDVSGASSGSSESSGSGPFCGDGTVDEDESCDTSDPPNASCSQTCDFTCLTGFTDCDEDASIGCSDLAADGENCAVCGRTCFSEECGDSVCVPVEALEMMWGYDFGGDVLRSGDFLIAAESYFGGVRSYRISDGTAGVLVPDDAGPNRSNLAAAGDFVFYLAGGLWRVPADGSATPQLVANADGDGGVAANGTHVYFFHVAGGATSDIRRIAIDGAPGSDVEILADLAGTQNALAVTPDLLVWSNPSSASGDLETAQLDGSSPQTVNANLEFAGVAKTQLHVSANSVFYRGLTSQFGSPGVRRFNTFGNFDEEVIPQPPGEELQAFSVSNSRIFVTWRQSVVSYDKNGSDPRIVYTGPGDPNPSIYGDDELVAFGIDGGSNPWTLAVNNP